MLDFIKSKDDKQPIYKGSEKDFNKYFSGYCRNLVQKLTKHYKVKIGRCEYCNTSDGQLDSAHLHGKERKEIIKKILSNYTKGSVIKINLNDFKVKFIQAHTPIEETIKILCKGCHTKYDNKEESIVSNDKLQISTLPIGKYVRARIVELQTGGHLNPKEILRLQNLDYSREIFISNFEILRKSSRQKKDHLGVLRYYKDQYIDGYWLTSQWYERQRESFDEWVLSVKKEI
jgi:protein-arginine kinase activator protein McsA